MAHVKPDKGVCELPMWEQFEGGSGGCMYEPGEQPEKYIVAALLVERISGGNTVERRGVGLVHVGALVEAGCDVKDVVIV